MTAPAGIRQSELKRAAQIVKDSGVVVEIERNGLKIRLMPDNPDIHRVKPIPSGKGIRL